jgi:hypothetical protein
VPVDTAIEPELPLLVVPELNTKAPLIPFAPAFTVPTVMAPLVVAVPAPLLIVTAPPVCTVPAPAVTAMAPPKDNRLKPAVTVTPPPVVLAAVDSPAVTVTAPP